MAMAMHAALCPTHRGIPGTNGVVSKAALSSLNAPTRVRWVGGTPSSASPKSGDQICPGLTRHASEQVDGARGGIARSSGQGSVEVAISVAGGVREIDKDSFWPAVEAAGEKTVVLDMYTQWCGPCKLMLPKLQKLSETYTDVVFLKLDCNQDNKSLAKEMGVRVVPTFKILKNKQVVAEVAGAKYDELVIAIDKVRTAS